MSWAVRGDVGERGPTINFNVFEWLHNIQTKRFFNTVKGTGPCLGEHGPVLSLNVFEKHHPIQTKNFFHIVKYVRLCFREHHQPFIWTLLKLCITSRRNDSSVFGGARSAVHLNVVESLHNIKTKNFFNAARLAGPWQGMLIVEERGPAINLNVFEWLHNIQTKRFFNIVKGTGLFLREHGPAINLNVLEKLLTIQKNNFFNSVNITGPCLSWHYQPFIWTVLKVCIRSRRKCSLTPRNELDRDKRCWGARPSHKLECFQLAAWHPDRKVFQNRERNWAVVGGARPKHTLDCFRKVSYHPDDKLSQHREMSWSVFGGARPAVHLNVIETLHNI